jgi:hypothetical protein
MAWQYCVESACRTPAALTLGVVVDQVHAEDGATCWGGDGECRTQLAPEVGIWRCDAHASAKGVLQEVHGTAKMSARSLMGGMLEDSICWHS